MANFDFTLEQMRSYQGLNPRPDDFDAYWDKAIGEMKAIDPQITLTPPEDFSVPNADCFDLYFTGVKGARVYAKYLRPKQIEEPVPAVVMFHGYSGHSGDWHDKLSYVSQGFAVAVLDARGQGGKSEEPGGVKGTTQNGHIIRGLDDDDPHNLLFRHIFLDTAQLAGIVMGFDEVDENRVGTHGGSQGGGLALACAALEPRIKSISALYPFLCDYRRAYNLDLDASAYGELKRFFRYFDPLHKREDEIFTKLGYIDVQHLAARIRGDVLMGTALCDMTCPPSSQFAAYNKIVSNKRMEIYPDFAHENLPGFNDMAMMFHLGNS